MKEKCCTPLGQIKRYVDCIGCDKKPGEEIKVLNLKDSAVGEIAEYPLYITSQKYKELLVIQKKPEQRILFKGIEVTPEKLIEILEQAKIPQDETEKHQYY